MKSRAGARLLLTQFALNDLSAIYDYSVRTWDKRTADRYLDAIESGLSRIQTSPGLLEVFPNLDSHLRFYRVRKHLLICDVEGRSIVLLTVVHASVDLPTRLTDLLPTLTEEIKLLRSHLRR
jgi:toxin ParE1/3/4